MLCYLHVNCLSSTERKVCVVATGEAGEHILQEQMNRCADLSALSMLILVIKVNVHALCVWLKHVVVTVRDSLTGDGRSFVILAQPFAHGPLKQILLSHVVTWYVLKPRIISKLTIILTLYFC